MNTSRHIRRCTGRNGKIMSESRWSARATIGRWPPSPVKTSGIASTETISTGFMWCSGNPKKTRSTKLACQSKNSNPFAGSDPDLHYFRPLTTSQHLFKLILACHWLNQDVRWMWNHKRSPACDQRFDQLIKNVSDQNCPNKLHESKIFLTTMWDKWFEQRQQKITKNYNNNRLKLVPCHRSDGQIKLVAFQRIIPWIRLSIPSALRAIWCLMQSWGHIKHSTIPIRNSWGIVWNIKHQQLPSCILYRPMLDHSTECSNLILSEPTKLNSNAKRCPRWLEPMVRVSGRNLVD